jgi:hypothetical protein
VDRRRPAFLRRTKRDRHQVVTVSSQMHLMGYVSKKAAALWELSEQRTDTKFPL